MNDREEWREVQEWIYHRIALAEDALARARDGNDDGEWNRPPLNYLVTQLARARDMIQGTIERLSGNPPSGYVVSDNGNPKAS